MNPEKEAGTVYAVEAGGLVKIGYTSGHVGRRVAELQRMNGNVLELVRSWKGSLKTERALHATFKECRQQGEWFALPDGWEVIADRAVEMEHASGLEILVEDLLDELHCAGHTEIAALDLIDCLATAGLTLNRDGGGQASGAYFGALADESAS